MSIYKLFLKIFLLTTLTFSLEHNVLVSVSIDLKVSIFHCSTGFSNKVEYKLFRITVLLSSPV